MNPKSKVFIVGRIFTGLMALVFGLNYFMEWFAIPEMSAPAVSFLGAMMETGYLFPLIAVLQIVAGIAFLSGYFVPLAALLLAPFTTSIVVFHLFLDPVSIPGGLVYFLLNIWMGAAHWEVFKPLFKAKA